MSFVRGSPERKGELAPRRFLTVLSPQAPAPFKDGSGRRELALAIAARITKRQFRTWRVAPPKTTRLSPASVSRGRKSPAPPADPGP